MTNRLIVISLVLMLLLCSFAQAQTMQPVVLKPGLPAPELAPKKILQAPSGAKADWLSLRGKVVILEFWATWCAPCITVQPHLNDLIEKFKGKSVQVISITDEDESKVASFLTRRTLKGWVGLDLDGSLKKAYGAFAVPKTVVVDAQGNIVAVTHAKDLTAEMLDQMLAGNFTPVVSGAAKEQPTAPVPMKPNEAVPRLITLNLKPSKASSLEMMMRAQGRFEATGADLKSLFSSLLGVRKPQIYLTTELNEKRYDITANIPNDRKGNLSPLLVNALEISLNLKVRRETREIEVFVLTAPKSLTGSFQPSTSKTVHVSSANNVLVGEGADVKDLIFSLENLLEAPVINETNLSGKYDWDLIFDGGNRASLIEAVRNQCGLVLVRERRPVEVVVIETDKP